MAIGIYRRKYALAISTLLCTISTIPAAFAADFGPIDKINDTFNAASRRTGSDLRMVLTKCSADRAKVCTYSLSGGLGTIASSSLENHSVAKDIAILFGKDSDPLSFLAAIGTAMVAWSPQADRAERGQALTQLISGMKDKQDREVIIGSTRYKFMILQAAGLWLVVEKI